MEDLRAAAAHRLPAGWSCAALAAPSAAEATLTGADLGGGASSAASSGEDRCQAARIDPLILGEAKVGAYGGRPQFAPSSGAFQVAFRRKGSITPGSARSRLGAERTAVVL